MVFDPHIAEGAELTNGELRGIFQCSLMGGMNRSNKTNTLVLINNRVKSIYQDRIDADVIHYTGMGQLGDQDINANQNKTLSESLANGVGVHLFEVLEVLEVGKYIYSGKVQLAGSPYQEMQLDVKGNDRTVWMFPLRLKSLSNFNLVSAEKISRLFVKRERIVHKLGRLELQQRANQATKKPGSREVKATQYQRNEYVVEEARRRANGVCQLCESLAPFKNKHGIPHLEVHHIVWLARDGEDSLENTVALCPNCHRKMHLLDLESDKNKLTSVVAVSI